MSATGNTSPKGAAGQRGKRVPLRTFAVLGRFLKPYRLRVAAAALALVVAAGAVLAFGSGLRWLIDNGFTEGAEGVLDTALFGLLAIVGVLALATFFRAYFVNWIGERIAADIRRAVFANVIRLDPAFYEVTPTGEVLSRLTTDTTLLQTIVGSSASMALRNTLMMIGGVIMMAVTSPKLTGLVLIVVPAVVLPLIYFGRKVRRLSRDSQDRIGDVGAHVDEALNAVSTIQAFNREETDRVRFNERVEDAFSVAARRILARAILTGCVILMVFAAIGTILYIGGHDLIAKRITAGDLSAFVFYAAIVAGAMGVLSEFMADLQRAAGASERLVELLEATPKIAPPPNPKPLPEPGRGEICFDRVEFRYPSRPDTKSLDSISLTIGSGETVALVGPSGAGKSTLFQLLLRFYDPAKGRVLVDGVPLTETDPAAVRARIGLVPQEPVIFTGSVAENIRFGRPDADMEAVRAAAESAAALTFIEALPNGFDTHLGEKGVRLSGGQRQRLAIARAVLRDPVMLLLDEATSALDAESERLVQGALDRIMEGRTTLVIAHRLATVMKAGRIIVMDDGRIVGEGSHETLLRENPLYAHLAALQFDTARAAE